VVGQELQWHDGDHRLQRFGYVGDVKDVFSESGDFTIAFGRYGYGLPSSCVSQGQRFTVYSIVEGGSVHAVTWTHNAGAGATFKIEVSRNGGGSWSLVTAAAPASGTTSGSYNWTVTSPRTSTARMRVTWTANAAATDTSNVSFRIN
jgi:hypothetical protein